MPPAMQPRMERVLGGAFEDSGDVLADADWVEATVRERYAREATRTGPPLS